MGKKNRGRGKSADKTESPVEEALGAASPDLPDSRQSTASMLSANYCPSDALMSLPSEALQGEHSLANVGPFSPVAADDDAPDNREVAAHVAEDEAAEEQEATASSSMAEVMGRSTESTESDQPRTSAATVVQAATPAGDAAAGDVAAAVDEVEEAAAPIEVLPVVAEVAAITTTSAMVSASGSRRGTATPSDAATRSVRFEDADAPSAASDAAAPKPSPMARVGQFGDEPAAATAAEWGVTVGTIVGIAAFVARCL
jgi:hypothetical protein